MDPLIKDPQLQTAYNWTRNYAHLFKEPIHGPLFTEISVDSDKAKYLEKLVSPKDLVSFLCEDKEDKSLMLNMLNIRNKLNCNVIYCPAPWGDVRGIFRPKLPIYRLKELGFKSFLWDSITAPPTVLTFLCHKYKINEVAIAETDKVFENLSDIAKEIDLWFYNNRLIHSFKIPNSERTSWTVTMVEEANLLKPEPK